MTEFEDLQLNREIADMEEDEAKKTLSEFIEAHKTNRTAYDELHGELDEVETEYEEKIEDLEERLYEFKEEKAEEAAEHVNMPADILVDRFSVDELDQILDEAAEFSEEEEEEDEEDEQLTSFAQRDEKGRFTSEDGPSEDARELVHQHW